MIRAIYTIVISLGLCFISYTTLAQVVKETDQQELSSRAGRTTIKFGPLLGGSGIMATLGYGLQPSRFVGYGAELDYSNYAIAGPYCFGTVSGTYRVYPFAYDRLFLTARVGYGLPVGGSQGSIEILERSGGLAYGGALGFRLSTREPAMEMTFGARSQAFSLILEEQGVVIIEDSIFRRLEFSIGLSF